MSARALVWPPHVPQSGSEWEVFCKCYRRNAIFTEPPSALAPSALAPRLLAPRLLAPGRHIPAPHTVSCMLRHNSVMRSYFTYCMLCLRAPRVGPSMRPSGTACDGVDGSIVCDPFCSCEYGYIRSVHVNDLARNLAISIIRKSALFY